MDRRGNAVQVCVDIQIVLCLICATSVHAQLQAAFYGGTCTAGAEVIVSKIVQQAVQNNRGVGAGLLRMHFHDCFVNGCDGSVLIDSTSGNEAEKDSPANNPSLHGFEVIDAAKSALETSCPGIVSCADILAFAARDSVVALGGPSWTVRSGRRDGRVSRSFDITSNIPAPTFNLQQLTQNFAAKGLSQDEMVTLSGAHTVGVSHCSSFSSRLYNFSTTTPQDPSLDIQLANRLQIQCPNGNASSNTVVNMDSLSPFQFDNNYYNNVQLGKVLFSSDETLTTDSNTETTVQTNSANEFSWRFKFAQAMIKMSEIGVMTGQQEKFEQIAVSLTSKSRKVFERAT